MYNRNWWLRFTHSHRSWLSRFIFKHCYCNTFMKLHRKSNIFKWLCNYYLFLFFCFVSCTLLIQSEIEKTKTNRKKFYKQKYKINLLLHINLNKHPFKHTHVWSQIQRSDIIVQHHMTSLKGCWCSSKMNNNLKK